jgi:hypothetical protein
VELGNARITIVPGIDRGVYMVLDDREVPEFLTNLRYYGANATGLIFWFFANYPPDDGPTHYER